MDLISEILSEFRPNSTTVSKWVIHEGAGVTVNDFSPGYFLSVVSGPPINILADGKNYQLQGGDSIVAVSGGQCKISRGEHPVFTDLSDLPWEGVSNLPYEAVEKHQHAFRVEIGEGSNATTILGIAYTFDQKRHIFATSHLPPFIHLTKTQLPANDLMGGAIDFLTNDEKPGYFAMAVQLAGLAVISALRSYILNQKNFPTGILRGLTDKRLAQALQHMHQNYSTKLSVAELATIANMSRSTFAAKFTENIGETPMNYLNIIRVRQAVRLLEDTHLKSYTIAERCGFNSDRMMRSTIKKITGLSPREIKLAKTGNT